MGAGGGEEEEEEEEEEEGGGVEGVKEPAAWAVWEERKGERRGEEMRERIDNEG